MPFGYQDAIKDWCGELALPAQTGHSRCWSVRQKPAGKRTSIHADVQEVLAELAEPFPGTVAQGVVLVFAREMNEFSFGQNQRHAQIRMLGARRRRE